MIDALLYRNLCHILRFFFWFYFSKNIVVIFIVLFFIGWALFRALPGLIVAHKNVDILSLL